MGRWHAHAVARSGGRVAAVVDPDVDRARRLASRHAGCAVFPELDGALEAVPADVAHVCTPSASHAPLVERVLDAGLSALVEKPLAGDLATTRGLVERARARGVLLAPVHQFAFQRGVRALIRGRSRIGAVVHVEFVAVSAGAGGGSDDRRRSVAAEILPHPLSLFPLFLPLSPLDMDWAVQSPRAGELRIVGQGAGAAASVVISMSGRPPRTHLEVTGERATGRADLFHGFAVMERGGAGRGWKLARPFLLPTAALAAAGWNLTVRAATREPAYPGLRELVRRFHAAALAGQTAPIPAEAVLAEAEVRERILSELSPGAPQVERSIAAAR